MCGEIELCSIALADLQSRLSCKFLSQHANHVAIELDGEQEDQQEAMEALSFGYRDELLRVARKRIENAPGTYQPDIYGEYEAGGTSWLYISPAPFDQAGFDPGVPRQPILHYVKDFLAVVPMVLTIWPGLFAGIYLLARHNRTVEDTNQEDTRHETIER